MTLHGRRPSATLAAVLMRWPSLLCEFAKLGRDAMAPRLRVRKEEWGSFVSGLGVGIVFGAWLCYRLGLDYFFFVAFFVGFPVMLFSHLIDRFQKTGDSNPS